MKYSAFISYSHKDKLFVDALVHRVEMEKIPCWYAPRDIPPGMAWPTAISQAVPNVSIMILVLSESSNYSQEVSKELTLASNNRRMVIPVRIADIQPNDEFKYHLSNRHWLDVYDLDMEAAIDKILATLLQHRQFYLSTKEGGAEKPADSPAVGTPTTTATSTGEAPYGKSAQAPLGTLRSDRSVVAEKDPKTGHSPGRHVPLWMALDSVFLITFNLLFFLLQGSQNPASIWLSYGFIHIAYLAVLVTPRFASDGRASSALSLPLYLMSSVYFLTQLALGIGLIWLEPENYLHSLTPQLLLLAVFVFLLLSNLLANKSSSDSLAVAAVEHAFIKKLKVDIEIAMGGIGDTQKQKLLEMIHDDIKASSGKSHPCLNPLEKDIAYLARKLSTMPAANVEEFKEVTRDMQNLLEERNKKLRAL